MLKEKNEFCETHTAKGMEFEICALKGNPREYLEGIFNEGAYEATEGIHKVAFGSLGGYSASYENHREECVEFALDIGNGEILDIWVMREK